MKIVQFVNAGYEIGGAEKMVRLLTEGLRSRGHVVTVVATDQIWTGHQHFADRSIPAISGGVAVRSMRRLWYREGRRQVAGILAELEPDCVHFHTVSEFSLSLLAATRGYPRVLTVHGPEDWMPTILRWNLPSAASLHGMTLADRALYLELRFARGPAWRRGLRRLDATVSVSSFLEKITVEKLPTVPSLVIPNCVAAGFDPTPITDPDHVVYVGRLVEVKGVAVLLRAFRSVAEHNPRARLTIVGDGPERSRLEAQAADLSAAGRVVFTGWLSDAGVAERIGSGALVVIPSLWPEAFGRTVLDAYACGRPVIASQIGGLPELVDGDTGVLVAAGQASQLASALARLLGDLPTLQRLGTNAVSRIPHYTLDKVLDLHEKLYAELQAGRVR